MASAKTLIFAALHMEANAIANSFGIRLASSGPTSLITAHRPCDLYVIGIRATKIPPISRDMVSRIIVAGLAGALDPALKPGDIVRDSDGQTIHTASKIISTAKEKSLLFHHSKAIAVDMESAVVRHRAVAHNIPVLTIRAISDTADESLSPKLLGWIDNEGRPKAGALTVGLVMHPWLIPNLIRLGSRSKMAMEAVAKEIHKELD